jgi:hypothetical protein
MSLERDLCWLTHFGSQVPPSEVPLGLVLVLELAVLASVSQQSSTAPASASYSHLCSVHNHCSLLGYYN